METIICNYDENWLVFDYSLECVGIKRKMKMDNFELFPHLDIYANLHALEYKMKIIIPIYHCAYSVYTPLVHELKRGENETDFLFVLQP